MLFQLSDVEYTILDTLADGPLPFSLLIHELRRRKQPWDPTAVLTAFNRLFETRLIRSTLVPGAPTPVLLSYETLKAYASHFPNKEEAPYWLELTDDGKTVWESWQQAA